MEINEAFKIVYDELIKFRFTTGVYNAKHGDEQFMFGVHTIMEIIANKADETGNLIQEFNEMFFSNMCNSVERSGEQ